MEIPNLIIEKNKSFNLGIIGDKLLMYGVRRIEIIKYWRWNMHSLLSLNAIFYFGLLWYDVCWCCYGAGSCASEL